MPGRNGQLDQLVAQRRGRAVGDRDADQRLIMFVQGLGEKDEPAQQGLGDRRLDPGPGDGLGGFERRRIGRGEFAAFLEPLGAGDERAALGGLRAELLVEAAEPVVAVELADVGVGDGGGMIEQALAEAGAGFGRVERG